jgi:hypothetical protein
MMPRSFLLLVAASGSLWSATEAWIPTKDVTRKTFVAGPEKTQVATTNDHQKNQFFSDLGRHVSTVGFGAFLAASTSFAALGGGATSANAAFVNTMPTISIAGEEQQVVVPASSEDGSDSSLTLAEAVQEAMADDATVEEASETNLVAAEAAEDNAVATPAAVEVGAQEKRG